MAGGPGGIGTGSVGPSAHGTPSGLLSVTESRAVDVVSRSLRATSTWFSQTVTGEGDSG